MKHYKIPKICGSDYNYIEEKGTCSYNTHLYLDRDYSPELFNLYLYRGFSNITNRPFSMVGDK